MDFTRSLYLGLPHDSRHLRWTDLTTGAPAAVHTTAQASDAAERFAALVGCERAVAMRSSLHAFMDLFGQMARRPSAVIHDACLYPVARWGLERIDRAHGLVLPFLHRDAEALEARLAHVRRVAPAHLPCWVVCDGYCPSCAQPAPLPAYAALAARYDAWLLVDDTQAVGLFGRQPTGGAPYGRGGGGSLRRWDVPSERVVIVASLAKAFGAPLAMVAGPRAFVEPFTEASETLLHCSPPSHADLAATNSALKINGAHGDALRARLAARIQTLRRLLDGHGLVARGGLFPVQRLMTPDVASATALHDRLLRHGVETIVQRGRCTRDASLSFILTARHSEAAVREAARALAVAARSFSRPRSTRDPSTLEA